MGDVLNVEDIVVWQLGHWKVGELFLRILVEDIFFFLWFYIIDVDFLFGAFSFYFTFGGDVGLACIVDEGFKYLLVFLFLLFFLLFIVFIYIMTVGHLQAAQNSRLMHCVIIGSLMNENIIMIVNKFDLVSDILNKKSLKEVFIF